MSGNRIQLRSPLMLQVRRHVFWRRRGIEIYTRSMAVVSCCRRLSLFASFVSSSCVLCWHVLYSYPPGPTRLHLTTYQVHPLTDGPLQQLWLNMFMLPSREFFDYLSVDSLHFCGPDFVPRMHRRDWWQVPARTLFSPCLEDSSSTCYTSLAEEILRDFEIRRHCRCLLLPKISLRSSWPPL